MKKNLIRAACGIAVTGLAAIATLLACGAAYGVVYIGFKILTSAFGI